MRFWLLSLSLFLLAGCTLPSGVTLYPVTPDMYWGLYKQGALDACMSEAREELKRMGVPLTVLNLQQAWQICNVRAEELLLERGHPEPQAVPLPTAPAPHGGERL